MESEPTDHEDLALFTVGAGRSPPIKVKLHINAKLVVMELDTGADISIISESTYKSMFSTIPLQPCAVALKTYIHREADGCAW